MTTASPPAQVIAAPTDWRCVDFLSDVHLHAPEMATFAAWQRYLLTTTADAVFILGDLFEVWVGDDVLSDATHGPFWRECVSVLRQACDRLPVHYMVGNRDFLAGPALLAAAGLHGLSDPSVLDWGHDRWLLSHGDGLCTTDLPYQAFRQQVRQTHWQQPFLAQPLVERLGQAQAMRQASESLKTQQTSWVDVDSAAALQALKQHGCSVLVHGHTHRADRHLLDTTHERWVLSDWEANAQPPRLQVLRASRPKNARAHKAPGLIRINL